MRNAVIDHEMPPDAIKRMIFPDNTLFIKNKKIRGKKRTPATNQVTITLFRNYLHNHSLIGRYSRRDGAASRGIPSPPCPPVSPKKWRTITGLYGICWPEQRATQTSQISREN
jgi:hypothetical protein